MQDRPPPLRRSKRRTALAVAALCSCALWLAGGALAQDAQPWKVQLPQWPADLFGGAPEPPTDSTPQPVHDPANPDHARLQPAQEAFSVLPADAKGRPDWARALREELIHPRASKDGSGPAMTVLDLDVLMKNTAQMPYVKFPHQAHTQWLACSNCHDGLFVPKAGANPITMPRILAGESCGVCHTKVAFTAMFTCERCHSVPQPGQQKWW